MKINVHYVLAKGGQLGMLYSCGTIHDCCRDELLRNTVTVG